MTDAEEDNAHEPVTFGAHHVTLDDWRDAADALASENAHLTNTNADLTRELATLRDELELIRDTLQRRTDAMHRVALQNDHLRTLLANQENQ